VEEVGAFDVSVIRIARNNSARGAESAAAFFTVPFCYLRVPMRARANIRYVSPSYFRLDEDYIFYILSEGPW